MASTFIKVSPIYTQEDNMNMDNMNMLVFNMLIADAGLLVLS